MAAAPFPLAPGDPPQMPTPAPVGPSSNVASMLAPPAPPPDDPQAQQSGPPVVGPSPSVSAMLTPPAGAPPPNPIDAILQQMQQGAKHANERAAAHEAFLRNLMTTDALGHYLPKPSARQMLSDAMTNFGMARLTGGNFTPIQARRYEEAFKRHEADVQNTQLALTSDRQDELQYTNQINQTMSLQKLIETQQNNQAKQEQAHAETERKRASSQASADARAAMLREIQIPAMQSKALRDEATASNQAAMARLALHGGGNMYQAAANYAADNNLDWSNPKDMEEYKNLLSHLKDATTRFNPNSGTTSVIKFDSNGQPWRFYGSKDGETKVEQIKAPGGASGDDFEFSKIAAPERKTMGQIKAVYGLASDLKDMLETTKTVDGRALKDVGDGNWGDALGAKAGEMLAYQQYIHGLGNKNDLPGGLKLAQELADGQKSTGNRKLDQIIQYTALLRVLGSAPLLGNVRNMQWVKQIQDHLPNEKGDTPAQTYEKLTNLLPQWENIFNDTKEAALHPASLSIKRNTPAPPPPRGTGGPPGPAPLSSFGLGGANGPKQ